MKLAEVFGFEKSKLNWPLGLTVAIAIFIPLVLLALVGQDVYWLSVSFGVLFVGPELGRIDRAARTLGPDAEEVRRRVRRLFLVFRFDTALLALIVLDMTAKPALRMTQPATTAITTASGEASVSNHATTPSSAMTTRVGHETLRPRTDAS